jgi:hypothetical protein
MPEKENVQLVEKLIDFAATCAVREGYKEGELEAYVDGFLKGISLLVLVKQQKEIRTPQDCLVRQKREPLTRL